ncbi:uncharacterized protein LOC107275202 isoform X2 [Cephus cinctus]|uniref:Uncharacterized protein LOC107275202 isoform X2 n=1 Tax=Cephus cinctus TaxID=211228 RepID=A0AAJ7BFH3_CEPCN|nr:uncharacterized protein LOC107275202 isoform X2 [Cephus cinctus]
MKFYQSIKQIKEILNIHGDLPVSSNINLEGMKENELPSSFHAKQSEERLPSEKYEIQNYIFDWNAIPEVFSNKENERRKLREINRNIEKETQTYKTILKLLTRGANPNYPTAPYPVLIMAIFSKSTNLVQQLLLYGADPNVTLSKQEYSLAPLHILAVIEPSFDNSIIAKSLIHANADVNLRTDSTYRPDVKARVSESRSTEFLDDSQGFTALHLLALRSDYKTDKNQFLTQLVCALLCNGSNKSYQFYQGHSALSLAIVEENIDAMKLLLQTGQINVNEQLGYDVGSCMLMMVSCRLQEKLSASFIEKSIPLLMNFGGCPLTRCKIISRDYNQLEYAREELHSLIHKSSENVSDIKMDSKLKEHEEKKSVRAIYKYFVEIITFLENAARNLMKRRICGKIVRKMVNSYSYSEIDLIRTKSHLDDKLMKFASAWMNATELAFTMSIMKYGHEDIKKVLIAYLGSKLRRISTSNNIIAANAQKIISGISDNNRPVITNDECTQYSERHVIHPPETDPDVKKFMVCFECFMMHNKVLIWCPICRLVLFCSQTCNINNIRRSQNPHTCKELENLERIANSIGVHPREFLRNYMLKSDNEGSIKNVYKYNRSMQKKNNSPKKWKPHEFSIMPEWKKIMLNVCKIHKVNVKNKVKDMELRNYDEVKASEEDNLPIFTNKKHYLDIPNYYYMNLESNISQINKIANQASSLKSPVFDVKRGKKQFIKGLNDNWKHYADYYNDEERMREREKRYYVMSHRTQRTSIECKTREKLNIFDISIKKAQQTDDTYKHNEKLGDDEEKIAREMYKLKNIQDNKVSCINKNRKSPLGKLVNLKNENMLDKGKRKSAISQNNKYSKVEEKHAHSRLKKEMISDKNRYIRTTVITYELKKTNQQKKQFFSRNKKERQLLQNEKRLNSIKKYKINPNNAFNMSAVWLLDCDKFAKELNSKTFTLSYIAFSNGDIYYSNKQIDQDTKAIDNYSLL